MLVRRNLPIERHGNWWWTGFAGGAVKGGRTWGRSTKGVEGGFCVFFIVVRFSYSGV